MIFKDFSSKDPLYPQQNSSNLSSYLNATTQTPPLEVTWPTPPENCPDETTCKLYKGESGSKTLSIYVGGIESNWDWTIENSAGFTDSDSGTHQSVYIVSLPSNLNGVVRGASETFSDSASDNLVSINLNNAKTPLVLDGISSEMSQYVSDPVAHHSIAGASVEYGDATNNSTYIQNSTLQVGSVYGALSSSYRNNKTDRTYANNKAYLKNVKLEPVTSQADYIGTLYPSIYGFYAYDTSPLADTTSSFATTVTDNLVYLEAVTGHFQVIAGNRWLIRWASLSLETAVGAKGNKAYIVSSELTGAPSSNVYIIGGSAYDQDYKSPTIRGYNDQSEVLIQDSQIHYSPTASSNIIYGAYYGSQITDTRINIVNSTLDAQTDGGAISKANTDLYGATANASTASQRDMKVTGIQINIKNSHLISDLWNSVTISLLKATDYRWWYQDESSKTGHAFENPTVKSATLSDNHLSIVDSEVNATLRGFTISTSGLNADSTSANFDLAPNQVVVHDNSITVENSKLKKDSSIYLGEVNTITEPKEGTFTHNLIHIGANVTDMDGQVLSLDTLYGAYVKTPSSAWDNNLIIESPLIVKKFGGYRNLQFGIPDQYDSTQALLTVTGEAVPLSTKEGTDWKPSTIRISASSLDNLQRLILIDAANGFIEVSDKSKIENGTLLDQLSSSEALDIQTPVSVLASGSSIIDRNDYSLKVVEGPSGTGSQLVADFGSQGGGDQPFPPIPTPTPSYNGDADALLESNLSAISLLQSGSELFTRTLLQSPDGTFNGPFAATSMARLSTNTQTRIVQNNWNALAGVHRAYSDSLNTGAFIEVGNSHFKTYPGGREYQGELLYAGAGLFVTQRLGATGLQFNSYVKVGQMRQNFDLEMNDVATSVDHNNLYWGAFVGLSYEKTWSPRVMGRTYLNYYIDAQTSTSLAIQGTAQIAGAHLHLNSLHSERVALGQLFFFEVDRPFKPFVGFALERAFHSQALGFGIDDTQASYAFTPTDFDGLTGQVQLGYQWTSDDQRLSVEVATQGQVGTSNGIDAQANLIWHWS